MDTDAKGQLGGIECGKEAREKMAKESHAWKCAACAKSNAEIMLEREDIVRDIEEKEGKRKEEEIPEELKLAYRDELGSKGEGSHKTQKDKGKLVETSPKDPLPASANTSAPPAPAVRSNVAPGPVIRPPAPTRTTRAPVVQPSVQHPPDRFSALIDTFIYAIVAALIFMVLRRFAS
jgi:ubiquitin-conjugating enzyme E2 J1